MHPVKPCPKSGGGDALLQWENITPPGTNPQNWCSPGQNGCPWGGVSPTGQVSTYGMDTFALDPSNFATIYLGTANLGIWKSLDCGATWAHINTGSNGSVLDGGRQFNMIVDPINPQIVYTSNGYGTDGFYKSTNGGVDFTQMIPTQTLAAFEYAFVSVMRMDPTDHLHFVVAPHFSCVAPHSTVCLLETTDGGGTWTILENAPPLAEGSGVVLLNYKTWVLTNSQGGLYLTTDEGASWNQISKDPAYPYLYQPTTMGPPFFLISPGAGVLQSTDGMAWNTLATSPSGAAIVGDGMFLYTAGGNGAYSYASLSDPTTWTALPSPGAMAQGGFDLGYDSDHHILYSSNALGGFWRIRTR
jgi:hypothetical protein